MLEPHYDSYPAGRGDGRRHAIARCRCGRTPPAGSRSTSTSWRRRSARGTRMLILQHAAQPDRHGADPRRTGRHRRSVAVERDLIVVTDEVYEYLIFDGAAHLPARHPRRHGGAHGDDLQRRQDVQRHGLEDRLGLRSGPADRRGPGGQAVPHLRRRRAVPAGRRRWRCVTEMGWVAELRDSLQAKRDRLVRRAGRRRVRRAPAAGHVLRDGRHPRRSARTDGMRFCLDLPRRAGVVAVPARGVPRRPGRRKAVRAVRLLQARRGHRRRRAAPVGDAMTATDGVAATDRIAALLARAPGVRRAQRPRLGAAQAGRPTTWTPADIAGPAAAAAHRHPAAARRRRRRPVLLGLRARHAGRRRGGDRDAGADRLRGARSSRATRRRSRAARTAADVRAVDGRRPDRRAARRRGRAQHRLLAGRAAHAAPARRRLHDADPQPERAVGGRRDRRAGRRRAVTTSAGRWSRR